MTAYELKILEERDDLINKIKKLKEFMYTDEFEGMDPIDKGLLMSQLRIMNPYFEILQERIERF